MTTLTCPKCRHGMPDDALDTGHCPACGFPLDGPLVFASPGSRSHLTRYLITCGIVALLVGGGFAGYTLLHRPHDSPDPETADAGRPPESGPDDAVQSIAPYPHEPKQPDPGSVPPTNPAPETPPVGPGDKGQPPPVDPPKKEGPIPPPPPPVDPPKKEVPRPIGVVMKVDPRIEPKRHFDHPDDTAAVPDLNSKDHVVLTGRVRILRLGAVNGKGSVDASGLVAEEVLITGDVSNEAMVTVNAPSGKVTLNGWVAGSSKVTIRAPGGVVVLANSGRFTGGSTVTITAKRLEALGPLGGSTKVNLTCTAGGSLKLTRAEEGATVTYRKAAAGDPALAIEKGEIRGGAKVLAQ
jgi:hypothetical protein